jgi:glycosyltransferase involved in cell wall biosynthesis
MTHARMIVVSLLDGKGPTGVEAHFMSIIDAARSAGVDAVLAAPYPCDRLWARLLRRVIPVLRRFSRDYAEVLSLRINSLVLAGKLTVMLAGIQHPTPVTLYAQDPVSARVALRAGRRHGCRVAAVVHYNASQSDELATRSDTRRDGPWGRFLHAAETAALPRVDRLLFVSRYMQRTLAERLPALDAVPQAVIMNVARQQAPAPGDLPFTGDLIAIGTLETRKNQAFLLHVLASAKAQGCRCTLTLVGNGPDEPMLRARALQLGVHDQVTFAGFQPDAARLIAGHRVVVHAALLENLPVALVEALAAGRPIMAPAVGGIPEIFSDGVEGAYWPLDDSAAAARLLIGVLRDQDTHARMAQAAQLRYRQAFQADVLLDQWLAAILGAPARPPSAAPGPTVQRQQAAMQDSP